MKLEDKVIEILESVVKGEKKIVKKRVIINSINKHTYIIKIEGLDAEIGFIIIPESILPPYMIAIENGVGRTLFAKEPFWERGEEKELFLKCWDKCELDCEAIRVD